MDNYAAEEEFLRHVFEANVGVALSSKGNLWLDAGIFGSHIGFESAISTDNFTLTRSLLAENSPYYLAGAKVSYSPTSSWTLAVLVTNGWQRIRRVSGNSLPSFGTQVNYTPNDQVALNWSTFIGTDDPDRFRRMRYFNNLCGQFSLNERLSLIAGFDIGAQQESKGSSNYQVWYSPVLISRYQFNSQWAAAARAEYYSDRHQIIIAAPSTEGFRTTGLSLNADYSPHPNVVCRTEARWLRGSNPIFLRNEGYGANNIFLVGSIALHINK
ncbi:Porin [Pontibacter korlensis]